MSYSTILTLFVSVSMWTIHTLRKKTVSLWKQLPCMKYQLKKAHEQGLKRADVPPFLGLKRTERSNEMPA